MLLTSAVTFLIRRTFGAGAGDFKLMAVIAAAAGMPGVLYFLIGMSVALIVYVIYGTLTKKTELRICFSYVRTYYGRLCVLSPPWDHTVFLINEIKNIEVLKLGIK